MRELQGLAAGVVADDHTALLRIGEALDDVLGQALCGLNNSQLVHAAIASAHTAAQASSTEDHTSHESLLEGGVIALRYEVLDLLPRLRIWVLA